MNHRERKQAIRSFMQNHYTDERLAQLLAHAQTGRLAFRSCCCFIGSVNAPHALTTKGDFSPHDGQDHTRFARQLLGGLDAERAYGLLAAPLTPERYNNSADADELRRRLLIPMIRAEQKRREARRAEFQETLQEVFA